MAIKDWTTQYPTDLDTNVQQPVLYNDNDNTRVSHVESLRDAVQELEAKVGSDNLEAGSLRALTANVGADGYVVYSNSGTITGANTLYWDDSNKRLGIGTTNPIGELDVRGPDGTIGDIYCTSISDTASHKAFLRLGHIREGGTPTTLNNDHTGGIGFFGHTGSGYQDFWNIYGICTADMTPTTVRGNLYITARNDTAWTTCMQFKYNGEVRGNQMYSGYTIGGTNKDVYIDSTGLIGVLSSSERFKYDITDMQDTSWLYNLRPVNFKYNQDLQAYNDGEIPSISNQYGFIAEEVEPINSDFVSYDLDGYVDGVLYSRFVPVLVNEIKVLKNYIDSLESRINTLEGQ